MKTKALLLAVIASTFCHGISFAQSGPPALPQPMDLLDIWYFQDTNWFDAFGDAPISNTNLTLVSTWDGNGLQVDSSNSAWLNYPFESDGYPNLFLTNGTIRFWFVPNWVSTNLGGSGPGDSGRLIDVGAWTSNASYGWWSLYVDPAGCNIYFSAQTNNGVETNYLYSPIAWDGTTWHEIELTYSASNTVLYLDGTLATNGPGVSILPPPDALTNGFYVGSDSTGLQQSHGQFDELWTFGNQQTDTNDIASEYAIDNATANPPPHFGGFSDSDPSGGTAGYTGGSPSGVYNPPYGSNDFWLQILPPRTNVYNTDSNSLTLILHGTTNFTTYQIWTTTNLSAPINWTRNQIFPGAANTNFTVYLYSRTNGPTTFFKAVNYSQDSDDDGLPDWWELQYSTTSFPLSPTNADTGNTGIPDGYKQDSAGDGYNNLQKFQMGIPPNVFITPPAPNNFTAILNTNGSISFSWSAAPNLPSSGAGAVTGYSLQIAAPLGDLFTNITLAANQTSYVFTADPATLAYLASGNDFPDVSLQTDYANTNSAEASQAPFNYKYQVEASIVRGPQGRLNLIAPNIPTGVQAIRVYVNENIYGTSYPKDTSFLQPQQYLTNNPAYSGSYTYSFDAPISGFTNGIYIIPYSQIPIYLASFQYSLGAVANDGSVGPPPPDKIWAQFVGYVSNIPFLDGRTNLQQNLAFLMQAADASGPFSCYAIDASGNWVFNTPPGPDYVSAGFSVDTAYQYFNQGLLFVPSYSVNLNEFQPFEDNYFYRNFVATSTDINSDGSLKTGVYNSDGIYYSGYVATNLPSFMFDTYTFCAEGQTNAPQAILTNWQWTYFTGYGYIGVTGPGYYSPQFTLLSNQSNYYGLPFTSAEVADFTNGNLNIKTLTVGNPVTTYNSNTYYLFPQTAAPELTTVGYYFARTVPFAYYSFDPQPGDGTFATTNTTPLMIEGVGGAYGISGWAKQAIINGDPTKFAYLEQYFDHAYLCDTNGNATTNSAGILSEYGEFFPMYPGKVALVTKPDITTGQRGTNLIYVIALQLDFNHDGTMDPSFTGPDSTSPARPFQFWLNNNYDRWHTVDITDSEEDDLLMADSPYASGQNVPDYNYMNADGNRTIPCVRDLEDFARLWTSGVDSNLIAALPTNSTITLSWGDVGYPNTNNPTIDLFLAADPDGGTGYLTNAAIATNQINSFTSRFVGRLGPGGSINLFSGSPFPFWQGSHFIWCGVNGGSGPLTLTIMDGNGNVLAQSSVNIQLQDIKQMYERWTVGDAGSLPPTNVAYLADDNFTPGQPEVSFQFNQPSDTNTTYILQAHGWNMKPWDKDRYAETEFKRLYWQGYQGRFGTFRWPTQTGFTTFNASEYQAWHSAIGLYNLLTNLNSIYPGNVYLTAHSMGNVVATAALRMAGSNRIVNTFVAMQAALASHAYDPTTTNRSLGIWDSGTPDRHAQYWTNEAPCFANGIAGASHFVNFFNPQDWALSWWNTDQNLKPATGYSWASTSGAGQDEQYYYTAWDGSVTALYFSTNTYNIFSFITEGRCFAVGAQTNVGGAFAVDGVFQQVELDLPPYNFGDAHKYHSAEFRSDNVNRNLFWNSVLTQMRLTSP